VLELSIIYHLVIGQQYKLLLQEDIRVPLQLIALLKFVLMDIVVIPYALATAITVILQALWEHAQMLIQIAQVIVIFVVQVTVQQMLLYVLVIVTLVLVLERHIAAQLFLPCVPEPAPRVLVQVQHIAVHLLLMV